MEIWGTVEVSLCTHVIESKQNKLVQARQFPKHEIPCSTFSMRILIHKLSGRKFNIFEISPENI